MQGELKRFLVDSQREGIPPYLVDLDSLDCHGACPCEHFQHRLYDLVKANQAGEKDWMKRGTFYCIHLVDAREYFLSELLHKWVAMEKAANPNIKS